MRTKGAGPLTTVEIEQAKNLFALKRSYRAVARELGRSPHTVKKVLTCSAEVVAEVATIKANLADRFEGLASRMIDSIDDADIEKLNAYQRTLSGAIAVDKVRLLRGEPSAILGIEVLLKTADLIRCKLDEEDQDRAAKWQQAHALPAAPQIQPSPQQPASLPTSEPQPIARVARYYDVPASPIAENESLLFRGLPVPPR
ncbi:MAG: hypothetical protein ACLPLR_05510 [Terriglobales bacterium]